MTRDRAELQSWYRQAMLRRVDELRDLRGPLRSGEASACDDARRVGQALRGSGATFGFDDLSVLAALVETSADDDVLRRVEGLIRELTVLTAADPTNAPFSAEWLAAAAQVDEGVFTAVDDVNDAWTVLCSELGVDGSELATRVARYFGLGIADLGNPARSARRLVPEALMASGRVVPLNEDSVTITVATADPTSLRTELELERLTGRRPVFVLAPPDAIEAVLGEKSGAAPPPRARPAPTPSEPSTPAPSPDEQAILVVDDDASARVLLRALLEKRGYDIVEAGDGVEALEVMREDDSIGLVVADLNMPRMDGLELMWALRDAPSWAHLPVIVVTGEVDEILETQLMEEGADDYIRKPVDPRLFLARVEATIRRTVE